MNNEGVLLSVVIPARNEEGSLPLMLRPLTRTLREAGIPHELVVVDDNSTDRTWDVLQELRTEIPELNPMRNTGPNGFGRAIAFGLQHFQGDRVTIMMADASDPPNDLVVFNNMLTAELDCVFGSRAMRGSKVIGYPPRKWFMNRAANLFLCVVFQFRYNDVTNPFKLYRRSVIERVMPLTAKGFELEVELPLKAMVRGARYTVVPNGWQGREVGESKMVLAGLWGPYLRVVRRMLVEKWTGKRTT
ncbi:MAG: glycosyltransferase family 2 protein [Flavobacteriales bacterium]|nr:glycosyltransferase family 2 protein [Flavobacteriales bacterium]